VQKKTPSPKPPPLPNAVENIDYDSLWKYLIEAFGFQFLNRFLPEMYPHIDLSYPIEYLDQEFPSKLRPRKKGRKLTDKLMKVRMLSGESRFVLTHVEVHATGESTFAKKMYLYNSLIYLEHEIDITAIAIFTTERYPIQHNLYTRDCYGTEVRLKFNSFIISKQDERKLLKSDDLFDLAILACLYIIRTRNDMKKRLYYKKKLHKMAEEKSFSHIELEKILIFVEDILQLPVPLELKFKNHLKLKNKKLEAMELSINSQNMFAAIFEGMYGMTPDAMKSRAAVIEQKAAVIEQKAAVIEQKAAVIEQKAAVIEQKAEKRQSQLILLLYVQNHLSIEKIAHDYEIDLDIVKDVIKKHLDTQQEFPPNTEGV
jgi:hypothetical protein